MLDGIFYLQNKMKNLLTGLIASIGIIEFTCFAVFIFFLSGICLHYDIHFWATMAKHHEVNPSWALCLLIGLVPGVGQLSIPGAFITWICSFFL